MKKIKKERTEQNSRKIIEQNGDKQSIRSKFKALFIRMLRELSEDLNSIK